MQEAKFKMMTEQLRMTNSDEQVAEYLKWIISSDMAKNHWVIKWISVEESLPKDEVNVLCFHSYSENYFICYRTKDCLTNEPKWFGGSMPTHWKYLDKP
jgi:hypothetical protein